MIASEEFHKAAAEAEDRAAGMPGHSERLRDCGVRIDFLLAITFAVGNSHSHLA